MLKFSFKIFNIRQLLLWIIIIIVVIIIIIIIIIIIVIRVTSNNHCNFTSNLTSFWRGFIKHTVYKQFTFIFHRHPSLCIYVSVL